MIDEVFLYDKDKLEHIKFDNKIIKFLKEKSQTDDDFNVSNSITIPFNIYIDSDRIVNDILKQKNIKIIEFFNFNFYSFLRTNDIEGAAINVDNGIMVDKLSKVVDLILNDYENRL